MNPIIEKFNASSVGNLENLLEIRKISIEMYWKKFNKEPGLDILIQNRFFSNIKEDGKDDYKITQKMDYKEFENVMEIIKDYDKDVQYTFFYTICLCPEVCHFALNSDVFEVIFGDIYSENDIIDYGDDSEYKSINALVNYSLGCAMYILYKEECLKKVNINRKDVQIIKFSEYDTLVGSRNKNFIAFKDVVKKYNRNIELEYKERMNEVCTDPDTKELQTDPVTFDALSYDKKDPVIALHLLSKEEDDIHSKLRVILEDLNGKKDSYSKDILTAFRSLFNGVSEFTTIATILRLLEVEDDMEDILDNNKKKLRKLALDIIRNCDEKTLINTGTFQSLYNKYKEGKDYSKELENIGYDRLNEFFTLLETNHQNTALFIAETQLVFDILKLLLLGLYANDFLNNKTYCYSSSTLKGISEASRMYYDYPQVNPVKHIFKLPNYGVWIKSNSFSKDISNGFAEFKLKYIGHYPIGSFHDDIKAEDFGIVYGYIHGNIEPIYELERVNNILDKYSSKLELIENVYTRTFNFFPCTVRYTIESGKGMFDPRNKIATIDINDITECLQKKTHGLLDNIPDNIYIVGSSLTSCIFKTLWTEDIDMYCNNDFWGTMKELLQCIENNIKSDENIVIKVELKNNSNEDDWGDTDDAGGWDDGGDDIEDYKGGDTHGNTTGWDDDGEDDVEDNKIISTKSQTVVYESKKGEYTITVYKLTDISYNIIILGPSTFLNINFYELSLGDIYKLPVPCTRVALDMKRKVLYTYPSFLYCIYNNGFCVDYRYENKSGTMEMLEKYCNRGFFFLSNRKEYEWFNRVGMILYNKYDIHPRHRSLTNNDELYDVLYELKKGNILERKIYLVSNYSHHVNLPLLDLPEFQDMHTGNEHQKHYDKDGLYINIEKIKKRIPEEFTM